MMNVAGSPPHVPGSRVVEVMPISFSCQCGEWLTVHDAMAGRVGYCPNCEAQLIVPVYVPALEPELYAPESRRRRRFRRRRVAAVVLALLVPIGGIGWYFGQRAWEQSRRHYREKISTLKAEADQLAARGNSREAYAKYEELLAYAGDSDPGSTEARHQLKSARAEFARLAPVHAVVPDDGPQRATVAQAATFEPDHRSDQEHPDYGAEVRRTLLRKADARAAAGQGPSRWLAGLTPEQRSAVLLHTLGRGLRGGAGVEDVVRKGWDAELPGLVRTLDQGVKTAAASAVARALEELSPLVRPHDDPDVPPPGGRWAQSPEAMGAILQRLNARLEPIAQEFDRDVDHYLYRLWRDANDGASWADWP